MINRSTLRSQIAAALRDEVLAGRLPAGQHFTVKEIADQYGVSATPVREALVDLAAQGLLDVEQHRGFRVHKFSFQDFRDIIEARTMIIESVFRRATASPKTAPGFKNPVDGAVLESIRRRAEAAQQAALAGELDILIGYDLRFWRELGALVYNSRVADFLDGLRVQCWVYGVPFLRREPDLAGWLWAGHRDLVDSVECCDLVAAERIVAAHHDHWLRLIEKLAR